MIESQHEGFLGQVLSPASTTSKEVSLQPLLLHPLTEQAPPDLAKLLPQLLLPNHSILHFRRGPPGPSLLQLLPVGILAVPGGMFLGAGMPEPGELSLAGLELGADLRDIPVELPLKGLLRLPRALLQPVLLLLEERLDLDALQVPWFLWGLPRGDRAEAPRKRGDLIGEGSSASPLPQF